MFVIENIIRSAVAEKDKLSILVVQDGNEDYLRRLGDLPHSFYIFKNVNDSKVVDTSVLPDNFHVYESVNDANIRSIDMVMCLDRADLYNAAYYISNTWHLPLVVVNFATRQLKVPRPFFANVNIENPELLDRRSGYVSVFIDEYSQKSWPLDIKPSFINNIGLYDFDPKGDKILIDRGLPQEWIEKSPIKINERYTTDPKEARVYVHLWQTVTPLFFDCMKSKIPILTLKSADMNPYIEAGLATFVNYKDLDDVIKLNDIINNIDTQKPYDHVKDWTWENHNNLWNNIFDHVSNQFFIRGYDD